VREWCFQKFKVTVAGMRILDIELALLSATNAPEAVLSHESQRQLPLLGRRALSKANLSFMSSASDFLLTFVSPSHEAPQNNSLPFGGFLASASFWTLNW
jgi:hypothetical protein